MIAGGLIDQDGHDLFTEVFDLDLENKMPDSIPSSGSIVSLDGNSVQ